MISIYFGLPRCGKSTLICKHLLYQIRKRNKVLKRCKKAHSLNPLHNSSVYENFYTNFDNTLCPNVSVSGLGKSFVYPDNSLICIDEAGIEYNSRKTLSLSQDTIKYLKLHGHYCSDIEFYSQSYEDMDITIRRLAERYYFVSRIGPFTFVRRVKKFIGISDDSQIIDGYKFYNPLLRFIPFFGVKDSFRLFLRKPFYRYFDSHSKIPCVKELPSQIILKSYRR